MSELTRTETHHSQRAKLRQATFIEPKSGVKSHRSITLHNPAGYEDDSISHGTSGESSPLLGQSTGIDSGQAASKIWIVWDVVTARIRRCKAFVVSSLGQAVFKFALAYLLGSMCTFIPPLADLFGHHQTSKHTIATITVYFHPARSIGSMLKALIVAFAAFAYTATVSLISMGISVFFTDQLHQVAIGHAIVLTVFVGGGLGTVGWVKLNKSDPLVNISCSLASLSLISVLTSEGAVQAGDLSFRKIGQYLKMIVAGVLASSVVCFLVLPVSARRRFKENMVDATDALSDMLGIITSSFINSDERELEDRIYASKSAQHRKSAATLNQYLAESKFELNVVGHEKEARIQKKLVGCIQMIAQSIGGLRSAAAMQFVIIKQPLTFTSAEQSQFLTSRTSLTTSPGRSAREDEADSSATHLDSMLELMPGSPEPDDSGLFKQRTRSKFRTPRQIFDLFIEQLGPSMRSLAFTLKEILDELPYDPEVDFAVENNPKFRISLDRALSLYNDARRTALEQVYNKKDMDRDRPLAVAADWEEAAACCGHFSFSLLEVAEQVKEYLIILDELAIEVEERPTGRSWSWLKFWKRMKPSISHNDGPGPTEEAHRNNTDSLQFRGPKIKKPIHDQIAAATEPRTTLKRRVLRKLYNASSFLRRDDKKFAIKVGLGAMLYALPSYMPATRPIYTHWRGEWGLLSYMLVCSMTIGASNTTGFQRFFGTCLGAFLAVIAWTISNEHFLPLAIFGFCMAYWTGYIIVGLNKGPLGRFIMLTYNLSALYAYTLTIADDATDGDEEDDGQNPEIWLIATHRVVAVLTGCIWGLIITRLVWPISARRKIKDGLSLLWLRMGLIWKRDPLAVFTDGEAQHNYMNLREELELQGFLTKLQKLIETSKHEFSFRRPFPTASYNRILKSTSRMLEAFHAMNVVILKDLHASAGEVALLQATAAARHQLCIRLSHQFGVLASSMKLEYSIATDALPNTEHTRDRLLSKIFDYRKNDAEKRTTEDEDYGLLYTYALVTGQIGMEIQDCLKEVEALFGVLDEESLWLQ